MSNNLQVFNFENSFIHADEFEGIVWFVAGEVSSILGYSQTANALKHCRKARVLDELNKINGLAPATKWIPESDLYRLTMKSTLKTAEQFQDWVMEEVLPSIRKTGRYEMSQFASPEDLMVGQAKLMLQVCESLASVQKRVTTLEDRVNEALPKDNYVTILGFCSKYKLVATGEERRLLGVEAAKVCKQRKLLVDRVPDKRYGTVGAYPEDVLCELIDL